MIKKKKALQLVVLFGLVSLFGDMVYEGARSVNGPYLELFAANAATVGLIAGIGEFLGYAARLFSGYWSDKTKAYWLLTFIGYFLLASVPVLCFVGAWQWVAVFIFVERIGKAVRNPARDTILSQASSQLGTGFAFGLHEAMDQIGAVTGPLLFTVVFAMIGRASVGISAYQRGYAVLWAPYLALLICLFVAYRRVPDPSVLDPVPQSKGSKDRLSKVFWLYVFFSFTATAGFVNFILVAFHFKSRGVLPDTFIPLLYALAMGVDAVVALVVGKYYDVLKEKNHNHHAGLNLLILIPFVTIGLPFFIFSDRPPFIVVGVCLWGIVMGIHETIMRSAIADITSLRKRGTGYGIFNAAYGIAVFLGSALMGVAYEYSMPLLTTGVVFLELAACGIFFALRREASRIA